MHSQEVCDRFWSVVNKDGPVMAHVPHLDKCWPWTRSKSHNGYGLFSVRGRNARSHRVSWEIANGPVPPGLFVLHRCDNPPCVNPAHLFLGTHADNRRDAIAKGRIGYTVYARGETQGIAKLKERDVIAIRSLYRENGQSQRSLAIRFRVTQRTVWDVIHRTWRHV